MTEMPYGSWPSPLAPADLFAGVASPRNLVVDGDDLWWTETRPSEGGRQALVVHRDGVTTDVGPADWNTRTRVHEYGGAPFAVSGGVVVGANFGDQRWYRLGDDPVAVSSASPVEAGRRYADARFVPGMNALVAVEEEHRDGDREARNRVVLLDLDTGGVTVVFETSDFVAAPRPSPDGSRLVWLVWDHPNMPWDAAELWIGTITSDGVTDAEQLVGGFDASVCSPVWLDNDRLMVSWETDGRWQPTMLDLTTGRVRPSSIVEGEVGGPAWVFGGQAIAPLPDGRQVWIVTDHAVDRLVVVDEACTTATDLAAPGVQFGDLRAWRDGVAYLALEADGSSTVSTWTPTEGHGEVMRVSVPGLRAGDLPRVEAIAVPTPDGAVTHAFLHHPACEGIEGPADDRPPLIIFTHGGPTGRVAPVSQRSIAFWTTRGFAVADVNYRGSAGYGADYRNALRGRWGQLDVIDAIAVARGLAAQGVVDGDRMAIRGGSAGGFTTLAVLTESDHPFACGTSFFGVADLTLLAQDTHKFESRYLDGLVGTLPEDAAVYRERSPLHRTEHLSKPILVLQGLEDKVVPPAQSEAIVAAAAANGVPHAYIAFEGEQHGFRKLENLTRWHEAELAFYGQVMGFVPAGDLPTLVLD